MPAFGQFVIGPPGAGKTTYCAGVQQLLQTLERKVCVVNLDPANDLELPYECSISINKFITVQEVMEHMHLGPNGAMVYAMEYMEKPENNGALKAELDKYKDTHYFIFDCPGQIELYTHHNCVRNLIKQLHSWKFRLCAVHLVDSHYCGDPTKFISVLLTSLACMIQLEMPFVNVLSKIDLLRKMGSLSFNLDFYTEVLDLHYILQHISDEKFFEKYKKLNACIADVVSNYSLVSFHTLDIGNEESVLQLLRAVDNANGYAYGNVGVHEKQAVQEFLGSKMHADPQDVNTDMADELFQQPSSNSTEEKT